VVLYRLFGKIQKRCNLSIGARLLFAGSDRGLADQLVIFRLL